MIAIGCGLLTALTVAGCTSAPAGTASPTPEVTSAPPSPTSSASASPSATPSASKSVPSATPAPPDSVTIDITIKDGQVTPNGKKLDVDVGQTIVLKVTSDSPDEVHAHTSGDGYTLDVPANDTVTGEFELTSPGSYEVESHESGKIIVILNAR